MHWLMNLPELFAAFGTALVAIAAWLVGRGRYIPAGISFVLGCLGELIGIVIGKRYDLFTEIGLKRIRLLGGLTVLMIVDMLRVLLTA